MVTIEYNGIKVNVPESWQDVTLGEYEQFYALKPEGARERVALIAQVCKIDAETLLSWPAEVFNVIVDYVLFLYGDNPVPPNPVCEIDGVKYIVPIEDELTLGAYVDADEAQKGQDRVISNVLAIVCRPAGEAYDYKNNEARAAMFAAQPVSKVLGVMAFFLHCKQLSERRTQVFGNLHQVAALLPRNTELLRSLGGGIKLLRMWPVVRFCILNALLRYRLRRFSRTCSTAKTKGLRKTRKGS
jgi:hypothetical protein